MSALLMTRLAAPAAAAAVLALITFNPATAARYTLAGSDGIVVCGLSLEPAQGADGDRQAPGRISADAECAEKFTSLPQMQGWTGGEDRTPLLFLGADGEPAIEFQDIGDGIRVGRFPAGGIAYLALESSQAAGAENGGTEGTGGAGIAGTWTFARAADGSSPLCTVEMSESEGRAGLPAITAREGCAENIAVLDLAGWQLGEQYLSVHDSTGRERLSFSQQDGPVWVRDPGGSRPLFLIRTGN